MFADQGYFSHMFTAEILVGLDLNTAHLKQTTYPKRFGFAREKKFRRDAALNGPAR